MNRFCSILIGLALIVSGCQNAEVDGKTLAFNSQMSQTDQAEITRPTLRPDPTISPTAIPAPTTRPTIKPEPTISPTAIPVPTPTPTPTPTPVPTPDPTPTPTPTPRPDRIEYYNKAVAMPESPIRIIHHFNQNAGNWDYATAVELSRKTKVVGCTLRGLEGIEIAKQIQVDAGCDIALIISYTLEFADFSTNSVNSIHEQCLLAKNNGLSPSDVIFHYEGIIATPDECNAMFHSVESVWPEAVVGWYDYPGWHMGTSGFGTKGAVRLGTQSETVSYNLYMTDSSSAFMTIIMNLRSSSWVSPLTFNQAIGGLQVFGSTSSLLPALPWVSIMGTYGDMPQRDPRYISSQWGWRRDLAREPIEMYNLGRIIAATSIRYPYRGLVAYPGSFDHRYDFSLWLDRLKILIQGLRGDPFVP